MTRYLMLWEADTTRIPVDPRERGSAWGTFLEMTKQDMNNGLTKDWGAFVGVPKGFSILEGSEVDVGIILQKYIPFFHFELYPLASIDQVDEVIKAMSK